MYTKLKLEQVFYGHNGTGYGILASSDSSLNTIVENLCQQIGTPSNQEITPFLLSIPQGSKLFMILGQAGSMDNLQRKTLLFHAFAADLQEAKTHRLTAFTLWEGQYFNRIPVNQAYWLDVPQAGFHDVYPQADFQWNGQPCAVISNSFSIPRMRALVGERVNTHGWSSFSFQALSREFTIYVLSDWALPPTDRLCLKPDGKPIPTSKVSGNTPKTQTVTPDAPAHKSKPWLVKAFVVSLLLNIFLISGTFLGRGDKTENTQPLDMAALKEEFRKELAAKFPKGCKINNLKNFQIREHCSQIQPLEKDCEKLDAYVNFVNGYILNSRKEEEK